MTVAEVADRLRLHQMTVRRHIRSGRLRSVRAGGRIRVREEDVERFIEPGQSTRVERKARGRGSGDGGHEPGRHEMTPEEVRAWVWRQRTPEELRKLREGFEEMRRIRDQSRPLGMSTATLVRVSRRMSEVAYGEKTLEELIAEES